MKIMNVITYKNTRVRELLEQSFNAALPSYDVTTPGYYATLPELTQGRELSHAIALTHSFIASHQKLLMESLGYFAMKSTI